MSRTRLVVEEVGPLATIQDAGRPGLGCFGIPRSGPIDRIAFDAARLAVGNPLGAASLEVSLGGITLRCIEGAVRFAICGPGFVAELDGALLGSWAAARLDTGMRLRIRHEGPGNWGYLSFGGELETSRWMGSAATHALAGLGGGRITKGQLLVVEAHVAGAELQPLPTPETSTCPIREARVVIGPQERFFDLDKVRLLLSARFNVTSAFDRMGMVLDGPSITPSSLNMPSEPATMGCLQADGAGRLTLLLADHQTASGYPKIATVLTADVGRIAQLAPGAEIRFQPMDAMAANLAARHDRRQAAAYLDLLNDPLNLTQRLSRYNLISGVTDGDISTCGRATSDQRV